MALFSIFDGSFSIIDQFSVFQTTVTSATQARLGVPSSVLDEVGDPQGALDANREAVDIRRRLAAANSARYKPDLAKSVSVLSNRFEEQGQIKDAIEATEEALELMRLYAERYPDSDNGRHYRVMQRDLERLTDDKLSDTPGDSQ